ncbi:MAG: Gfo/Idh/MocA family oxidoreductase [Clostridia bacterium]|nr:Gfo/Idh/MocA family oxidoreductase [Clostridia bacterium]
MNKYINSVIVIGLGSMGKRRIRLLKQIRNGIKITGVDADNKRAEEAQKLHGICTAASIEEAVRSAKPQAAFICTSPLSHSKIISECIAYGLDVFTELNLVKDGYEENIKKAVSTGVKIFMSSTFQYREEVKYIKRRIEEFEGKVNYIYHVGQYLPDWHPWENYKSFFVGDKRTNGCREIFAIDLPWISSVFGIPDAVFSMGDKNTDLNIDYNDNYFVSLKHGERAKGTFVADVVSKKAVRNLEIFGENFYICWNGAPDGLYDFDISDNTLKKISLYDEVDKDSRYSSTIIENMYVSEIKAFLDYAEKDVIPLYTLTDDADILDIIDKIEADNG